MMTWRQQIKTIKKKKKTIFRKKKEWRLKKVLGSKKIIYVKSGDELILIQKEIGLFGRKDK